MSCIYLPLGIVDTPNVVANFTRAAAATVVPTVASTSLNAGNLSRQLILWHLGYSSYEVIKRLQIFNAVKVRPDFNILDFFLELRVLDPPE